MSIDVYKKVRDILSSKVFLVVLVAIVLLQGIWYALSFQPSILDEGRHIGFIELYSDRVSPFIAVQSPESDWLGEVTREPSYLYYYVMSWPLRVINLLTTDSRLQVISLRLMNILFFAGAIILYDKFFRKMGISAALSRVVLLFLIITPAIAVLPGVVSYDNLMFLLSGWLLYLTACSVKTKTINYRLLALVLLIALFGTLTKYTFVVLAIPLVVFLAVDIIKNKKLTMPKVVFSKVSIALAVLLLTGLGLFVERPVKNVLSYGDIAPSCADVLTEDRCLKYYVYERDAKALSNRAVGFNPKSLYEYTFVDWLPNMIRSQVRLNPWEAPILAMFALYSITVFGGAVLVLVYIRELMKARIFRLIMIAAVFYSLVLYLNNYLDYLRLGEVVATSSRYLLPVQPLIMLLVAAAIVRLLGKYKRSLLMSFFVLLLIFATGGSIITYLKTSSPELRWSNRADS